MGSVPVSALGLSVPVVMGFNRVFLAGATVYLPGAIINTRLERLGSGYVNPNLVLQSGDVVTGKFQTANCPLPERKGP